MEGVYYFGQGRLLVNTPPYNRYVDTVDDDKKIIASDSNKEKEGWKSIFNGYRFQIFSPSILRYK